MINLTSYYKDISFNTKQFSKFGLFFARCDRLTRTFSGRQRTITNAFGSRAHHLVSFFSRDMAIAIATLNTGRPRTGGWRPAQLAWDSILFSGMQ